MKDLQSIPKAKIISRSMSCIVECAHCEEEMIFDTTEMFLIEGSNVTCPYCNKISSVEAHDYLSQYN